MTREDLGVGIGLRVPHFGDIFNSDRAVDFFEIISENFMVDGGPPLTNLHRLLESYRVVLHGVSLSIASAEELNFDYLKKLKHLVELTNSPWFSDHLCWSNFNSHHYHDLLPFPYTDEYAHFVADKARIVQDYIERPFALENLSSYVSFASSEMTEWDFYQRVIDLSGTYFMLDVNNVYVSSVNHDFKPLEYLDGLDLNRVLQMHVAGHTTLDDGTKLDTHNNHVCPEVWDLYAHVQAKTGGVSTILEWDEDFLSFKDTAAEAHKAYNFQRLL